MRRRERAARAARKPVLLVINDLATGGAQRVAVSQAAGLAAAGLDVHVASLERAPAGDLPDECERAGVPVHRLRGALAPPFGAVPRLLPLLTRLRPAVVHTHLAFAGVAGRVAARAAGVPHLLATLHNLSDWQERAGDPLRVLDRRTLRWCEGVVAASEAIREAVARRDPVLGARARVIRNGVDLEAFTGGELAARVAERASFGFEPAHCVVGTVARLEPRKGVDALVGAFAAAAPRRPGLRLLVVGNGPERGRLEARVRAAGVADRVRFAGERRDVRPCLGAMDVFAAPSRTEGLGLAIIEAMAAGLPVLASHVGGIPEVAGGEGGGWLLPPGDEDAWAGALARVAADPSLRAAMGAASRRRAASFSLTASRRALHDLYLEVLGTTRAEAA